MPTLKASDRKKTRRPIDATLRNVRAANKLMASLIARVKKLEARVTALEARLA